ncbi:hypothetical protein JCM10914A_44970 [Paenibacillus sp. JCM 10914]
MALNKISRILDQPIGMASERGFTAIAEGVVNQIKYTINVVNYKVRTSEVTEKSGVTECRNTPLLLYNLLLFACWQTITLTY